MINENENPEYYECEYCNGKGRIPQRIKVPPGLPHLEENINGIIMQAYEYVECPRCHGTGKEKLF